MGICRLGVPEEMEIEIVTIVGWEGAMNRAFNPGGAEMILPAFASQLMTALGGTSPSNVSGNCSLTIIRQSLGKTVTSLDGVATFPQAMMPGKIRDTMMKILCFGFMVLSLEHSMKIQNFDYKNPGRLASLISQRQAPQIISK